MPDVVSRLAPRISDCHVHVGGPGRASYFAPAFVAASIRELGIRRCVVSSLSASHGRGALAEREILSLMRLAPGRVVPLLWGTPAVVRSGRAHLARTRVPYRGLKLHPYADGWKPADRGLRWLFGLAAERRWPVLMHTGWTPESRAGVFGTLYRAFPDVVVLLAHGRPLHEVIDLLQLHERLLTDTSFMPVTDLRKLVLSCGDSRLVFGSDFPLDLQYYPKASVVARYRNRVRALVRAFGETTFQKWSSDNFDRVFGG